jgi:hypothetical protein
MNRSGFNEQIALVASVEWERAKGSLRAVVVALGQMSSVTRDEDDRYPYQLLEDEVEAFILKVENEELHLP